MSPFYIRLLVFTLGIRWLIAVNADLRGGLAGANIEALFPGDDNYTFARQPFNQRFSVFPSAITFPASAQDISTIVKIGAANRLRVVARSGGHSYTANGLGGTDGALVIDLSKLKRITFNSKNHIAQIETGNRLGNVAVALHAAGHALPHGSCAYVGVGGHASYGGFGFASRMWGLLTDTIRSATIVLANGTIARVSEDIHPDIFWAIRGAAPSVAVVTSFEFQTFPEPEYAILWEYGWDLSFADAGAALAAFQSFCFTAELPSGLTAEVNLGKPSIRGMVSFRITGAWYGDSNDNGKALNATIAPLLLSLPPPASLSRQGNGTFIDTVRILTNSDTGLDTSAPDGTDTFYAKSLMTPEGEPMTDEACTSFMKFLAEEGFDSTLGWFFQIGLYGGRNSAINAVPKDATAFVRRDTLFTMQFYASSQGNVPPFPEEGFDFLDATVNSITSAMPLTWDYSAYTNYLDNRLEDWQTRYYGSHYSRLQKIKRRIDPEDVFMFPNSVEELL